MFQLSHVLKFFDKRSGKPMTSTSEAAMRRAFRYCMGVRVFLLRTKRYEMPERENEKTIKRELQSVM